MKNIMNQLSHMTMGEIAEHTDKYKKLLAEKKYLKKVNATIRQTTAQDLIDSIDTKIRRPHYDMPRL